MTSIPCSECGTPIIRRRRERTKYCRPCAAIVKQEKDRNRRREVEEDRALLRSTAENLRDYVTLEMWLKVEDYLAHLGIDVGDQGPPIVPDRMPEGAVSDAGPDEGTSTGYIDLADELERRRMTAIMHDWFADNPRWLDGVNG